MVDSRQETLELALRSLRKQLLPYLKDSKVVKGLGKFILCDLLEDVKELLLSKQAEVENCQRAVQEAKVAYAQASGEASSAGRAAVYADVQARTAARNQAWSAVMVLMEVRSTIMGALEASAPAQCPGALPDDAQALRDQYLRLFYARELLRASAHLAAARARHRDLDARYMMEPPAADVAVSVDPHDAELLARLLREYTRALSEASGVRALAMLVPADQSPAARPAADALMAAADDAMAAMETHNTTANWHELTAASMLNVRSLEMQIEELAGLSKRLETVLDAGQLGI